MSLISLLKLLNTARWKTPQQKDTIDRIIKGLYDLSTDGVALEGSHDTVKAELDAHIIDTALHRTSNGPPVYFYPLEGFNEFFPEVVSLANEGATGAYGYAHKWKDDDGCSPEVSILRANPFIPEKTSGVPIVCGLILEYCVGEVIAVATSASFDLRHVLANTSESFGASLGADPREGYWGCELPISVTSAAFQYQRTALYSLISIPSTDVIQDYDDIEMMMVRSYGGAYDLYRNPVYVVNYKLIFGYLTNDPNMYSIVWSY